MSSSRNARKLMKTISKFQKISLLNKSAYEGSEKNFSWLPFGWSRASYQENFDGLNATFNSTGIVADSIFLYANPEAASLQQENILLSSKSKCPAQRMLDQQTTHSHPKLKDLYRRRCGLPNDSNEVKDPLTDEQKNFIEKLKRCPNSPPTLDKFQATAAQGYSHVKTNISLPGNPELVSELPYWVKVKKEEKSSCVPAERTYGLGTYWTKREKGAEVKKDEEYTLPDIRSYWIEAENDEKIAAVLPNNGDFDLRSPSTATCCPMAENETKTCHIGNKSTLTSKKGFRSHSGLMSNNAVRFFSNTCKKCKDVKAKCQKLPSTVSLPSTTGKCEKLKSAGCGPIGRESCDPIFKVPCEELESPFALYSECLQDPAKRTEWPKADSGPLERCLKPNEGLSFDGYDPPDPKEVRACKPWKNAPPRSNDCNPDDGGCDPSIKPFKNASSLTPSLIGYPSPLITSRISETETLGSPFSISKRFYTSDKSSGSNPPKSNKKGELTDWLKVKSPNECKKRKGKCDPSIKPYKNEAAPPIPPPRLHSAPIITRIARPSDLVSPRIPLKRYFSAKAAKKGDQPQKHCFESKKIKSKGGSKVDLGSPVACMKPPGTILSRCERAKCAPSCIACEKPPPINQHKCPKKPTVVRKKKVKTPVGPKILRGYDVCNKPRANQPFQCKPRVSNAKKPVIVPTPKRCPCFAPMEFHEHGGSTCRKVPNAVAPNCNKPKGKDAEPMGKCPKNDCK